MFAYFKRFNGKIYKDETKSFVEAHNSTFWAKKKRFYDLETGDEILVGHRLIKSKKDYQDNC